MAEELMRHHRAMEQIAANTAIIEKVKTNVEITVITKAAELENERKCLELRVQKLETYESLKKKGLSDNRILLMFPSLSDFTETSTPKGVKDIDFVDASPSTNSGIPNEVETRTEGTKTDASDMED
jgi:hypothetical protein